MYEGKRTALMQQTIKMCKNFNQMTKNFNLKKLMFLRCGSVITFYLTGIFFFAISLTLTHMHAHIALAHTQTHAHTDTECIAVCLSVLTTLK